MSTRAALFDLAVARADAYVRRARVPRARDAQAIARALEVWHLKTRFAGRVPLPLVAQALATRPEGDGWAWSGGEEGAWQRDEAPAQEGGSASSQR